MNTVILGAGMAGFGASYFLNKRDIQPLIFEKKSYYGGHAASFIYEDGFIFDDGPHISFTKNERIQNLFADSLNNDYQVLQANVNNYWKGHWIKHPAQVNLHGLPSKLVKQIILEIIDKKYNRKDDFQPINYKDWLYQQFGETFSETFPMVYGKKYHTVDAELMSTDWLGDRLYTPKIEEVLEGALSQETADVHYVNHFRYPTQNGFVSYLKKFREKTDLHLNHEAVEIDPRKREVIFNNGKKVEYSSIISSVPLPDLIKLIKGVPAAVIKAASKLACSSCVLVNVGIDRREISESHWTYFYDPEIVFTRLSYPHKFSPNNAPEGTGSMQAEIYFSEKYKPISRSPEEFIQPVIDDLRLVGLIKERDKIIHKSSRFVKYANVIFDLDRNKALDIVHNFLDENNISYCGRYGEWGYHWTDESFISGENAAEKILKE